jgi:TonB-linked SusC/RagA family outer membrane protein
MKYSKPIFVSLLLLAAQSSFAAEAESIAAEPQQTQKATTKCTGIVTQRDGEPIIGASITVKGTKNIAVTDIDGKFSLSGVKQGAVLVISYVGCETKLITWNGTPLNVVLNDITLDEVVVVGYGTQKKINVTGAVSQVGSEVLEGRPVAEVSQALQGTIPGLNINTTSYGGMLDAGMTMTVRGTGTIDSGSYDDPLILIDGVEGSLYLVNPNDIESVSVLKDAAASSIYGSRAAFGVILVTTKSGKSGQTHVNYSGDVRWSTATCLPNMANSLEWANYYNTANINGGGTQIFSDETLERIQNYMNGVYTDPSQPEYYGTVANSNGLWSTYSSAFANTDWFKEMYKSAVPTTKHNLSVSGGNDKVTYRISGSFLDQNGLLRHGKDWLKRYTMSAKISAKLSSWARVDYNNSWARSNYGQPLYLTGYFFHNIARRWPTNPVKDPNGHWMTGMEIEELENFGNWNTNDDKLMQQLNFVITPLKGWNITANGSITTYNQKQTEAYYPISYWDVNDVEYVKDTDYGTTSYAYDARERSSYYTVNVYTDYTREWGKHYAKILLGVNYETMDYDTLYGMGYETTNADKNYLVNTTTDFATADSYYQDASAGYFARLNYNYDEKYLFEANIRYDGSSRFVGNKRWAWFPSFSAGWNMAKESFFTDWTDKISTLKIRGSWGQLGNTNTSSYYPFYQSQSYTALNSNWLIDGTKQATASLPSIVNSNLTWETVQSLDFGLDWAAFKNRLTGSFDWYCRRTKDMIGPAPILSGVLGTDAPKANNCDMRTNGWEFEISWRDRIGQVTYGVKANLSDYFSIVTKYPYTGEFRAQSYNGYHNGYKLGEIWGYVTEGIAQTDEQMNAWLENNRPTWGSNWAAGDVMYKDLNGDGIVSSGSATLDDHGDLVKIGDSTPHYRFGITLDAAWKGFDFQVFLQGVGKKDWSPGSGNPYFWGAVSDIWQSTVFKEHLDYWSVDNTNAYYPRPLFGNTKNQVNQTRYLQSAAYMRCKNMQLGYSLPKTVLAHAGISSCRIYVSVDNLFTITSLSSIFDPEAITGYYTTYSDGTGYNYSSGKTYPLQRTWSLGVSLNI